MKYSFLLSISFLILLALPNHAFASLATITPTGTLPQPTAAPSSQVATSPCPTVYNGGIFCQQSKNFSIDKTIYNPQTNTFVDFIDEKVTVLPTNEVIQFRITVKNTSENTLRNISVTDTLPAHTAFKSASNNTIDIKNNTVSYTISTLAPQQSNSQTLEVTVQQADELQKATKSVVNVAQAKQGNNLASDIVTFSLGTTQVQTSQTQQQISQPAEKKPDATVSKGGLPVYPAPQTRKAPNTGPETLALIALVPAALVGFKLRTMKQS